MMDDCSGAWESERERTQEKRCTAAEKSRDRSVRSVECGGDEEGEEEERTLVDRRKGREGKRLEKKLRREKGI